MRRRDLLLAAGGLAVPPPALPVRGSWGEPVVNLTFGAARPEATVRSRAAFCREVYFHDQFNQRNNGGGNYLADNMAPPEAEDPGPCERYTADHPFHEIGPVSLRCYVKPKRRDARVIRPQPHGADQPVGASGFRLRYPGPGGAGSGFGGDICWETRCRMSGPLPYYWWALWMCGEAWDHGAELDVPESFGFDNGGGDTNYDGALFHAISVGGQDRMHGGNWRRYLPPGTGPLTRWHRFTTIYRRDDRWEFYVDGQLSNNGRLRWTLGGRPEGRRLERCWFLIDNSWGHQQVASVRPREVQARIFEGFHWEYDYTRIWLGR